MSGTWILATTLVLLGSSTPLGTQERESGSLPIQVDEAIDRLPPIGEDAKWTGTNWVVDPAAAWLTEHFAEGRTLTDEQWRRALAKSRAVRVRERWPAGEPFAVGLQVPRWLPLTEIRLVPENGALSSARAGSLAPLQCGNCANSARRRARYQVLGFLTGSGPQEVRCQVEVERGPRPGSFQARRAPLPEGPPPGILWSGIVVFPVEVVPELKSIIPAFHGQELEAEVRRLLAVILTEERVHVSVEPEEPRVPATALSLELTLFEGREERGTESFLILPSPELIPLGVDWALPAPFADPSPWTIRVRGRSTDVLHDWDALRYWDGEFTIPLADAQRR